MSNQNTSFIVWVEPKRKPWTMYILRKVKNHTSADYSHGSAQDRVWEIKAQELSEPFILQNDWNLSGYKFSSSNML
jgi:hypothetical protein